MNRILKNKIHIATFLLSLLTLNAKSTLPQLGSDPIREVISAMTLEEKVKLLSSNGFAQDHVGDIMALGHVTFSVPRLNIASIGFSDGPAGIHFSKKVASKKNSTAFPCATLIASSWNTQNAINVGQALGHEMKEYGIDIILAPAMNAHRHPLGGRNFEYFSEDPLISGLMAASYTKGVQSMGVGTCLKHFVANEQETHRNLMQTIMSERALREIYLKGFKIAIQQGSPWSVMTSLNLLNGPYTSESPELLDSILRQEWGFGGFVMTDWFGGKDAAAQMLAGNDLLTPGDSNKTLTPGKENQEKMILDAIKNGEISENILDRNVERFLKAVLKAPSFKGYQLSEKPDLNQSKAIARVAATEGIILLKNENNTLPLNKNIHRIALFGNASYRLFTTGTGSGSVYVAYENPINQALGDFGYILDDNMKNLYQSHLIDYDRENPLKDHITELFSPTPPATEMHIDFESIKKISEDYDIAIITIGRVSGENLDREPEDFGLTESESSLVNNVSSAFKAQGKKVVVVLNIGGMIEIASWRQQVDAIVLPWLPGQEGGNAIVDILTGRANPSGRLATTYPKSLEQVPSNNNFPGTLYPENAEPGFLTYDYIPGEVTYEEGIYTGYRYHDTFGVEPAYPFGFGLSYATFEYSKPILSSQTFRGVVDVSITVTNTGEIAGKEVIQLYVAAPQITLEKPLKELRAFAKTRLLAPGESERVNLTLSAKDLESSDPAQSAWIVEAGDYQVLFGKDVSTIVSTANFTVPESIVVERSNRVLLPQIHINELTQR